jgi:hypothetical protein
VIAAIEGWYEGLAGATRVRVRGAVFALPSSSVLCIAAVLTPAAAGVGTHRQLGLAPCTMLAATGWPCPMCGMTTTFALLAHLRPVDALLNQPFGPVLFALTCVAAAVGWIDLLAAPDVIGRMFRWLRPREARVAWGLLAGMMGGWLYKAATMHPELWSR